MYRKNAIRILGSSKFRKISTIWGLFQKGINATRLHFSAIVLLYTDRIVRTLAPEGGTPCSSVPAFRYRTNSFQGGFSALQENPQTEPKIIS